MSIKYMFATIGFIGIGNMGLPMALNLIQSGFKLNLYDKNPQKTALLANTGAIISKDLVSLVKSSDIIITMVSNDEALIDIVAGDFGIAAHMTNNKIHISMSTVSPDTINKINLLHRKHKNFLIVAPVFGRPETAAMRELWIFLSGDSVAKTRALPILKLLSKGTYDFGENISSASIIKLASNFLVASAIASIGESCAFLEKSGLDSKIFADMIVNTLFSCQVYRYHAGNIASKKFLPAEFKQTLGLKDINLILKFSKEKNIQMPIAEIIKNNLLFSIENNQEDLDWSAMTLKCFSCQEFSQQFSVN